MHHPTLLFTASECLIVRRSQSTNWVRTQSFFFSKSEVLKNPDIYFSPPSGNAGTWCRRRATNEIQKSEKRKKKTRASPCRTLHQPDWTWRVGGGGARDGRQLTSPRPFSASAPARRWNSGPGRSCLETLWPRPCRRPPPPRTPSPTSSSPSPPTPPFLNTWQGGRCYDCAGFFFWSCFVFILTVPGWFGFLRSSRCGRRAGR